MKRYVLAGDVGGTKSDLALYEMDPPGISLVREQNYPSASAKSLQELLRRFLGDQHERIDAAAFGIPGPVVDGRVQPTQLPWKVIVAEEIASELGCPKVRLMNDLETTAVGALHLPESELKVLNLGVGRSGNRAVIAAGTGVGQAFLHWDGKVFEPNATEGGHVEYAPHDEIEDGLLRWLRAKYGTHVSWERVVSGPGLAAIFDYLATVPGRKPAESVLAALAGSDDRSAVIGNAGLDKSCPVCVEALAIFVRNYGAQAGNLALTVMALGGVYVGGGIVTKILPAIEEGFMRAFKTKGRYEKLMGEIPVRVILNPGASRIGAAMAAVALLG